MCVISINIMLFDHSGALFRILAPKYLKCHWFYKVLCRFRDFGKSVFPIGFIRFFDLVIPHVPKLKNTIRKVMILESIFTFCSKSLKFH